MKRLFYVIALSLFISQTVSSQYISNINPANIGDPRVVFANPAGIGYSAPQIVAGYQNLYAGLSSSLSNSVVGLVYPTPRFGSFAVTGQNFQAPLFSRTAIDLRYAWFFENLRTSVGLNLGTLATSYDRGEFQGVDLNDPLLAGDLSLSTFNMGFGLSSEIYENLMLGFSVDHLNKPTVSLQGEYKKDTSLRTGLMYRLGNFRPMALWEYDENEHYFTIGSEYWFDQIDLPDIKAMARGFVSAEHFSLGAGLLYKNIRLDYLFDYPMNDLSAFAGGTHQFVAAYTLGQGRPCAPPKAICVVQDKVLKVDPPQQIPVIDPDNPNFNIGDNLFELNGARYQVLNYNAHPFTNYLFFQADEKLDDNSAELYKKLKRFIPQHKYLHVDLTSYYLPDMPGHRNQAAKRAQMLHQHLGNWDRDRLNLKQEKNPAFKTLPNDAPIALEQQRLKIEYKQYALFHSSDSVCTFDLSHSKAECGWKRWQIFVYRKTVSGKLDSIWWHGGEGKPPEKVNWVWTRSLKNIADLNETYSCRLLIEDKKGNIDLSDPDFVFIDHTPSALPKKYVLLFKFDSQNQPVSLDAAPEPSSADLQLDEETEALLRAVAVFQKEGKIEIERVIGYTDTTGYAGYNDRLSLKRAETVHNYLNKYLSEIGSPARITEPPRGFGEDPVHQLFPSDTPQGRWMNRRVEIVVRPKRNE